MTGKTAKEERIAVRRAPRPSMMLVQEIEEEELSFLRRNFVISEKSKLNCSLTSVNHYSVEHDYALALPRQF